MQRRKISPRRSRQDDHPRYLARSSARPLGPAFHVSHVPDACQLSSWVMFFPHLQLTGVVTAAGMNEPVWAKEWGLSDAQSRELLLVLAELVKVGWMKLHSRRMGLDYLHGTGS